MSNPENRPATRLRAERIQGIDSAGGGCAGGGCAGGGRAGGGIIIGPALFRTVGAEADGNNINGPSLIRVPDWVRGALGRYYLYFAHHSGQYIRMAYANELVGPWQLYQGGVLRCEDGPGEGHIASPDVHVDHQRKVIRMYFHQKTIRVKDIGPQASFAAESSDGLQFQPHNQVLGHFYFRVFTHEGWHYALAKRNNDDGVIWRSRDGLTDFECGPGFLPGIRHTAVHSQVDHAWVFYTMVGEAPERIYATRMSLAGNWQQWRVPHGQVLLEPELDYEGANEALKKSTYGPVYERVRQLRDPAYFQEDGKAYLLYTVAGESGIALARLFFDESP